MSRNGYRFMSFSAMPGCCTMQPHTPVISSGFTFFNSLSQPTLPSARRSALSRTQQVLYMTRSASSRDAASCMPMRSSMPAICSLSCAFI